MIIALTAILLLTTNEINILKRCNVQMALVVMYIAHAQHTVTFLRLARRWRSRQERVMRSGTQPAEEVSALAHVNRLLTFVSSPLAAAS